MHDDLISVGSLHALVYCERLFYLEEVERIRVADEAVYAGRRLHVEISDTEEDGVWSNIRMESERLGLIGAVDVLRRRDGALIPYEHKRGRAAGKKGKREAWETDRIQIAAYTQLLEEAYGQELSEARVRYHADNVTVRVDVDSTLRNQVRRAVQRARHLRVLTERPPVTDNDRLCVRCSLAPVCLPEEARLGANSGFRPIRLLPAHQERKTIHVSEPGARVSRAGNQLQVVSYSGQKTALPIEDVGSVVVHGMGQVTTQALRLCVDRSIDVHWMTASGNVVGSLTPSVVSAQRQKRQFAALSDPALCLELARRLTQAKLSSQLRFVLRATRGSTRSAHLLSGIKALRFALRSTPDALDLAGLRGIEGSGAAAYFRMLPELQHQDTPHALRFSGRNRRPPKDAFNAALGFGYGMLYRKVLGAIIAVGLHPGFGFYHQLRSSAQPLALDMMELFRVPLVDMVLIGAFNRGQFVAEVDFQVLRDRVLLNETGRRKLVQIFERRLEDVWRHTAVGYSLSYERIIELEVRLLEKEWIDNTHLFAKLRIR